MKKFKKYAKGVCLSASAGKEKLNIKKKILYILLIKKMQVSLKSFLK